MRCHTNPKQAVAFLHGGNTAPNLSGSVSFTQKKDCVLVVANIEGLPQNEAGFYGFHIHEGGACTGELFADSKGHYNPKDTPHPHHAGDLPPIIQCKSKAYLSFLTDRFKVAVLIGRTVILHSEPDDFYTQPSGNAGTKIACGIIQRA